MTFDYQIDDISSLSAVFYGSYGRGGGTGDRGTRIRTEDGLIDFAAIRARNVDLIIGDNRSSDPEERGYVIRNSINSHQWFLSLIHI